MSGKVGFYAAWVRFPGEDSSELMLMSESDVEGTACDDMVFYTAPRRDMLLAMAGFAAHAPGDFDVVSVGRPYEADPNDRSAVEQAGALSERGCKARVMSGLFVDSWEHPVAVEDAPTHHRGFLALDADGIAEGPAFLSSNGRWQPIAEGDVPGHDAGTQSLSFVHESGAMVVLQDVFQTDEDGLDEIAVKVSDISPKLALIPQATLDACATHGLDIGESYLDELASGERSVEMASGPKRAQLGLNPQFRTGPGDGPVTERQLEHMHGMLGDMDEMVANAYALAEVGGITRNEASLLIEGARRGLDGPAGSLNVYGKLDLVLENGRVRDTVKEPFKAEGGVSQVDGSVGAAVADASSDKAAPAEVPTRDEKLARACQVLGIDYDSVQDGDEYDVVRDARHAMIEDDGLFW